MRNLLIAGVVALITGGCSAGHAGTPRDEEAAPLPEKKEAPGFNSDSAYSYVETLVGFGPRVPNTGAHRQAGNWLASKMKEFGWNVTEQKYTVTAFDGTPLNSRNIFAQLNPGKGGRILLLAHWDCRPWADSDPNPANHSRPVDGANDGASGVGVLMEIARSLPRQNPEAAVDILFVDAEDWGSHEDEDSWALGTRYFAANPPVEGYYPSGAILLDMVGSPDARFGHEYYSALSNPALLQKVWGKAASLGHGKYFHNGFGGGVTDDHVELIKAGIPSIDIIDYRNSPDYQGFDPVWHTASDIMDNISRQTLQAVGETVLGVVAE